MARSIPAGYQKVLEMFGPDPIGQGNIWFFDPTSTGNPTGASPENALRTAANINAARFATGDALVWRAGTVTTLTEKIRNNRMVGREGDPFFLGAYYMDGGLPKIGLGGLPRPCIDGLAADEFDAFGNMTQMTVMSMIPKPVANEDGSFKEGEMEGLFNWYQSVPYDLMLWVQDIACRYSGGRAFRFTQGTGGRARGLYMENCYGEGLAKQYVHLAGLYDAIIKTSRMTLTGFEINYANPVKIAQAAIATKGTSGDPDTPVNVWFDDPLMWCGWSTEAINSNSGNKGVGILDGFAVDNGCYGYYHDRTADMSSKRCITIRTDNEKFKDYRQGQHGRGTVGFSIQNEGHDGSFDWTGTYNTPEDFAAYQTHDNVLEQNIAIGYAYNFGFQSQASTKRGYVHEGRPHGAAIYFYGGLSVNPAVSHWSFVGNNNDAYVLDTARPPRVWGCAHIGDKPVADRNEDQFVSVFRANYFDVAPPAAYGTDAIVGGLTFPIQEYPDLSVLMDKDSNGWMNEEQALAFKAKVIDLLKPSVAMSTGIAASTVDYPSQYTMDTFAPLDFNGDAWKDTMPVGPFVGPSSVEPPDELEERVEELEAQVEELQIQFLELDERVKAGGRVLAGSE